MNVIESAPQTVEPQASQPATPEPAPAPALDVPTSEPAAVSIDMPADQIKQAVLDAEFQREAEAALEPFTISQNEDGSWLVKLETGETFKGTDRDVIGKLAKAKVNTRRHYEGKLREAQAQQTPQQAPMQPQQAPEQFQQAQQAQPFDPTQQIPPPQPSPTDDDAFAAQYIQQLAASNPQLAQSLVASALGIPAQQVQALFTDLAQTAAQSKINNTTLEFAQLAPDFPHTPQASAILMEYLPPNLDHVPTAQELQAAHARALYEGRYQPLITRTQASAPPRPRPAPMMTHASAPPAAPSDDPWSMPLNQLRESIMKGGQ